MKTLEHMRVGWLQRSLAVLQTFAHKRGRTDSLPNHLRVGLEGEEAAFFNLRRAGYTIVARRWSSGDVPGDVDLIAWDGPMLCFVEVKTRSTRGISPAETAVNDQKRRVLRRLARRYVRQLPQRAAPPVRFDVISVYLDGLRGSGDQASSRGEWAPAIQHFEGAFPLSGDNYEPRY